MRYSWIACTFLMTIALGCTRNKNVQAPQAVASTAPAVAPPTPAPTVQVNELAGSAAPPALVTKVVTVSQHGKPVTALRPNAFHLEENGQPIDNQVIDLRLLPLDEVIAFHTILLVDLSASNTQEGLSTLAQSANRFVQALRTRQSVTVLGFDGTTHLRFVGEFARNAKGEKPVIAESRFAPASDPSRDLRGAVLEALNRLDGRLKQSARPIHVGTLVVFSLGPDMANRTPETVLDERLSKTRDNVYFVGIQSEANGAVAQSLGRSGKALSADLAHLPDAFEDATSLITANMNSHYVLSYCSLARSGKPNVRVKVDIVNDELETATGALESQFNATGFSKGCNAARLPPLSAFKATAKN